MSVASVDLKTDPEPPRKYRLVLWLLVVYGVLLVVVSWAIWHVNDLQNNRRIESACQSVTQVKNAALALTEPTPVPAPDGSSIQEQRIATIRKSNAAKAAARDLLEARLACK